MKYAKVYYIDHFALSKIKMIFLFMNGIGLMLLETYKYQQQNLGAVVVYTIFATS